MGSKLGRLWKLIATSETAEGIANVSEKVFDLAETLNDCDNQKSERIKELVEKIPTLLEALNSPLGQVIKSSIPFLPIATGVIQFAVEINKKEPTVAETVAIVSQVAYLESIRSTIPNDLITPEENAADLKQVQKQLQKLVELEIDYDEATLALVYFHDSKLAEAFSDVFSAKLKAVGLAEEEIDKWVDKVAINTQQYISKALAEAGEDIKAVKNILDWYVSGGKEEYTKRLSINYYLEEKIKTLPEEKIFKERFSYQDIYVPLKALPLDSEGEKIRDAEELILETWVQKFIQEPDEAENVLFIQAGAGRGKSVFCRMLADWVRKNLHPVLTPIFIRLRDIDDYNKPIHEILTSTLSNRDFVINDRGWLSDRHTRYLFILDGFDELRIEGRATGGVEEFIQKIGKFQKDYHSKETGHKVIVTGREIALQGISDLLDNLKRVKLLPMDVPIQNKWLEKWSEVAISSDLAASNQESKEFKDFLTSRKCPDKIKELAKEPLLLYLLGKLHRKHAIKLEDFEQTSDRLSAKILVYEKTLELVLKEQREERLQKKITGLSANDLERILTEAGLCVVQSGGEYARVSMIETRLEKDNSQEAARIIKDLRAKSGGEEGNGEQALTTALGAFYIRPAAGEEGGGVEFYHKSFSEFLCAKRLLASLEKWTNPGEKRGTWEVNDELFFEQVYDLLGYGGLTTDIVEYLWGLLLKSAEFRPVELFERLVDFYERWCDGEFIDAEDTTLPQSKMRELKQQLPEREKYLGQRQVDVYAGLNIMILLLELHRYGQSFSDENTRKQKLIFHPCGKLNSDGKPEDSKKLLRVIGYSHCLRNIGFKDVIGVFLKEVNLQGANLKGTDFTYANLDSAKLDSTWLSLIDLQGANLNNAQLTKANLDGANLDSANLKGANLNGTKLTSADLNGTKLISANLEDTNFIDANFIGTDLKGANLKGANFKDANFIDANFIDAILRDSDFRGANLKGANFKGANLTKTNLTDANLRSIIWDKSTNWDNIQNLDKAKNVPEDLKRQLGLNIE